MSKFFVPKENIGDTVGFITGQDAFHIRKVLRKKPGDELFLCDSAGMDYQAMITDITADRIDVKILMAKTSDCEPRIAVTIFQGFPKQDKLEYIIMKTTELGASNIVPVTTKFAVAKPGDKIEKKLLRWKTIAAEAAKQCMRSKIPSVELPVSFEEAVGRANSFDLALIPYELESSTRLKPVLDGLAKDKIQSIAVYIGPEGGFGSSEIELALQHGIRPVTLGKRILRTETAGCAVMAMLLYAFDEI